MTSDLCKAHTKGLKKFIKAHTVSRDRRRLHFIAARDGPEGINGLNTPLTDSPTVSKNGGNSLFRALSALRVLAAQTGVLFYSARAITFPCGI